MLSSDKNVETIAQLIEALKNYMGLQKEYLKLNVIEKVVRLLTALTVAIVFIILGVAVLFYLSFALAYWMAPLVGLGTAFFIIGECLIWISTVFAIISGVIYIMQNKHFIADK